MHLMMAVSFFEGNVKGVEGVVFISTNNRDKDKALRMKATAPPKRRDHTPTSGGDIPEDILDLLHDTENT
jgi:hypothetical protein